MAEDYLIDYLGIDPTDYSAMERTIAGVPPVGQSIIPNMGVPATPQPRMIDATPIPFSPMPMQDFGSQISGLEEQIAQQLELKNINFEYETTTLKYTKPEKVHRYTPDFILIKKNDKLLNSLKVINHKICYYWVYL